jgi:hypothetical protein
MYNDKELAAYFLYWGTTENRVDDTSATADLFERIWSQVQNFQQGSIPAITATAVTMLDWVAREHCLNVNQEVMMELIHDKLQNTKSFA